MRNAFPERLSKVATLVAVPLALCVHLWVDPAATWAVRSVAVVAFGGSWACARRWRAVTGSVAVGAGAVLPAVLAASLHVAALNVFSTVWLAAVFGAVLPAMPRTGWSLPEPWRAPLATWGLTLSLAWPVMILREAGLRLGMLSDTGALDSWAYLTTPQVESWILYVVLAQLVGLLWLEWLYRVDRPQVAMHGLWVGASIASLAAVYQGTVDMTLLSGGPWPALRRAAGTLLDANAYGAVAALAGPIAFVSVPRLAVRHLRVVQAGVLALNWGGAWMSGSRTALLCGAFGTLLLMYELVREGTGRDARVRDTRPLLAGVAVVGLLVAVGAGAIGPLRRLTEGAGADGSLGHLWSRGGYGTVAARMVRDYPLTGVGVGSFNWMAPDYWRVMAHDKLPFDNAQNWWRHQVAELGVVASLPILLWSGLVAWLVVSRRADPRTRLEAETLRGLLFGVGVASMVGMPTQNPVVLVMFFSAVWRFDTLTRPADAAPQPAGGTARAVWAAGVLVAVGYAASHLVLARGPLKPLVRAERSNRDYIVGTYPSERLPQGQFRWTRKRATFALAVPSRYLVIRYHVEHPDASTHPVKVRITTACQTLVDEFRSDAGVGVRNFELAGGQARVVFDTDVSRTWRPSTTGQPDTRDLGVAIEADFIGTPSVAASQERWVPLKPCAP